MVGKSFGLSVEIVLEYIKALNSTTLLSRHWKSLTKIFFFYHQVQTSANLNCQQNIIEQDPSQLIPQSTEWTSFAIIALFPGCLFDAECVSGSNRQSISQLWIYHLPNMKTCKFSFYTIKALHDVYLEWGSNCIYWNDILLKVKWWTQISQSYFKTLKFGQLLQFVYLWSELLHHLMWNR